MNNIYDNETFFTEYAQMSRSQLGLAGAGEWHQMERLFPDVAGKRVLDLGCGYGWHCMYAVQHGAEAVLGIDISEKMLAEAAKRNSHQCITYQNSGLESYEFPENAWDLTVSNLALHYVADLAGIFRKIYRTLKPGGVFLMNIEHPVFTAGVNQDWVCDESGHPLYWPVDDYYVEGKRETNFLGCQVEKYHHTLQTIITGLLAAGFTLETLEEARPSEEMLPYMPEEIKRPMMLLVRAVK